MNSKSKISSLHPNFCGQFGDRAGQILSINVVEGKEPVETYSEIDFRVELILKYLQEKWRRIFAVGWKFKSKLNSRWRFTSDNVGLRLAKKAIKCDKRSDRNFVVDYICLNAGEAPQGHVLQRRQLSKHVFQLDRRSTIEKIDKEIEQRNLLIVTQILTTKESTNKDHNIPNLIISKLAKRYRSLSEGCKIL